MFALCTKSWLMFSIALIFLCSPVYAEKITVDREEYESLKKAVEYLMAQQKEVMKKASRAEEKADEASEVSAATAEVVEDSAGGSNPSAPTTLQHL